MTTLAKIAEQIKLAADGHFQTGQGMSLEEVKLLVSQAINSLFKTEKLGQISGMGDFDPSGVLIATYDEQPVYKYKDRSAVKLPTFPINLPMGLGVWYVAPYDDIDNFYVPMLSGQQGLTKTITVLNNYETRVPYEINGNQLVFSTDITEGDSPVTKVLIRMLVNDVADLGEYDPLPIPADMELPVVETVLKLMGVKKPTETVNNPKDHD